MKPIENKWENTYEYHVLKTDRGYFCDAWEEWDEDVENFSFTDEITKAHKFIGGLTPKWGNAPKYLWNDKEEKIIDNLKEAQEYFGGEILKVVKTEIHIEKFEFDKPESDELKKI
ncbi:hypothetical protein [Bacillus thuringiensis]|uniref:Uncharacterized protein n=1 Tax=Bacillus thuringiensis TaxID=1428 RepID=A0A9X6WI03_BACTU|nr:hypothetical protein [Bacillus thuringiensis]PFJ28998.1 hypothetical protein COJ15_32555 [Bacillus thuringiensis]